MAVKKYKVPSFSVALIHYVNAGIQKNDKKVTKFKSKLDLAFNNVKPKNGIKN